MAGATGAPEADLRSVTETDLLSTAAVLYQSGANSLPVWDSNCHVFATAMTHRTLSTTAILTAKFDIVAEETRGALLGISRKVREAFPFLDTGFAWVGRGVRGLSNLLVTVEYVALIGTPSPLTEEQEGALAVAALASSDTGTIVDGPVTIRVTNYGHR